jgi:FtsH-binding integral membrane protein
MSYLDTATGTVVSRASSDDRASFIRNTFLHLAGAVAAFAFVEAYLQSLGLGEQFLIFLSKSKWMWLAVMAAFAVASMVADKWARDDYSKPLQYAGLGLLILAYAVIFLPIIHMATKYAPGVLENAALITGGLVAGLCVVAFTTRKDFSFLGPILSIGSMIVLALIIASIAFGFQLGMFFSGAMIIFAAGSILYSLSNIIHVYRTDQHVAASLSLFSSVGLLFWYVLQFLMSMAGDD